jgi:hypothetical protein
MRNPPDTAWFKRRFDECDLTQNEFGRRVFGQQRPQSGGNFIGANGDKLRGGASAWVAHAFRGSIIKQLKT